MSNLVGYNALSVGEYLPNYVTTDMGNLCQKHCENLKYHTIEHVLLYTLFGICDCNITKGVAYIEYFDCVNLRVNAHKRKSEKIVPV